MDEKSNVPLHKQREYLRVAVTHEFRNFSIQWSRVNMFDLKKARGMKSEPSSAQDLHTV